MLLFGLNTASDCMKSSDCMKTEQMQFKVMIYLTDSHKLLFLLHKDIQEWNPAQLYVE